MPEPRDRAEVAAFLAAHAERVDDHGRRCLVRNDRAPTRTIQTGIGGIGAASTGARPRRRRRSPHPLHFGGAAGLPGARQERRRAAALAVPEGHFHGAVPGSAHGTAGAGRCGTFGGHDPAPGAWQAEHERWQGRDLSTKRYVYVWADGVYFTPRLEHDRQCVLILIGADAGGKKELLAIDDGFRESEQSWHELLVRRRDENGLVIDPSLPPAMVRSASGKRPRRSGPTSSSSAVGCIRRRMC